MVASVVEIGTPADQFPGVFQFVETAPVQVVWASAAVPPTRIANARSPSFRIRPSPYRRNPPRRGSPPGSRANGGDPRGGLPNRQTRRAIRERMWSASQLSPAEALHPFKLELRRSTRSRVW